MSSASDRNGARALVIALVMAMWGGAASAADDAAGGQLRVCADPNNLPFSNERREGFENAIAQLLADDMGLQLAYYWWPQRRGYIRNTLNAGHCDLVIGAPAHYGLATTTRPYYRSTYVFVMRKDHGAPVHSFDDARLASMRIGLHAVGDDYNNVPPAQSLAWRGLFEHIKGFPIYGDYSRPDPPRELIDAVAHGDVDVAAAWGPLAGYFAQREPVALQLVPVEPQLDHGILPMRFDIAMAVRKGDTAMRDRVQRAIDRNTARIEDILREWGVPLVGKE